MKHLGFKGSLCAALIMAAFGNAAAQTDPARQVAPADGWASQAGGTVGGSAAITAQIYTVKNRKELLAAIANGGVHPKIIKVVGTIDMSEGVPYTSSGDQSARGAIRLKSNTTLIGAGAGAGFVNGHIVLSSVSQIIIRNLKISAPCDVAPVWDPTDGATGNWNSAFDAISVTGSDHVWIDHNSFTDAPLTDDLLPIENGKKRQCHDGALDITNASDYVTVSYNHFSQHDKNNLIGSGDSATGDEGKLKITFSNNVFADIVQRAPRVRYGMVHLFNNYYAGTKSRPVYSHSYSVGVGHQAKILSNNNVFAITGAASCASVVINSGGTGGAFKDSGSTLNGAPLAGCTVPNTVSWSVPYAYSPRPVSLVKANALAQAGGGKLSTSISGTGSVEVDTNPTLSCPASGLYFCDDFQNGSSAKWDLLPVTGPNGSFSVPVESAGSTNRVLQYTAATSGGVLALLKPAEMAKIPSGDYYVEARIRPMTNGTTGNKHLYLLTRYVDASNWYGGGLNVQNATTSTQVEIAKMLNGSLSRPRQVRKPINMDAQFYTVRFELIGSTLTVYLDGENLGSVTDTAFAARGLIGLYTANKTFMIDDIRVGNPADKPVQLTIAPAETTWNAEAGDAPLLLTVTAKAANGSADSFTATSSNPAVVAVSQSGNKVTATPVGAGTARIVIASGSEPALTRSVTATILPQFVQPTQTYLLHNATYPAAASAGEPVDLSLRLTFDSAPTLVAGGSIRILRKLDDALVDVVKVSGDIDAIGVPGSTNVRRVNYQPVRIDGKTLIVKPHNSKLEYGTEYYVAIGNGVVTNTSLGGTPFVGIGKAGNWSFTTRAAPPASASVTVDDDGAADFRTVQGALNYAMKHFAQAEPVRIEVRNGSYPELLFLRGKDNVTVSGESRDGVVIHYTNYDSMNPGTGGSESPTRTGTPGGGRSVFLVETADMLQLENLTIRNTTIRSASISAQAEAIYFNSPNRLVAKNAAFHSEQDTLNLKGWSWFYRSLVAGNVDFIWGSARSALFEESEIRSLGDSANAGGGGYVLQARVVNALDPGFVFLNSSLTHGPGPGPLKSDVPNGATYLARSPGGTSSFDNIAFINCKMDSHVAPRGWAGLGVNGQPAPNPLVATAQSGWREYGSTDLAGAPLNLAARMDGYLLSAEEAAAFSERAKVFSGYGGGAGWNPQP
jgi:pectate lyase